MIWGKVYKADVSDLTEVEVKRLRWRLVKSINRSGRSIRTRVERGWLYFQIRQ